MRTVVEVFTSAAYRNGRAGLGIVLRAGGETGRVMRRAVLAGSPAEAAYRAILTGLWHARAMGTRQIRAYVDSAEVVAQLRGEAEVPGELTGLYLQVRALMNAYRWSSVEHRSRALNAEAALTALEALNDEPLMPADEEASEPLPLFSPNKTAR